MCIGPDEYSTRISRLSALLSVNGLDGLLLTAESNIDYFSGYRHHAPWTLFARPFFEVIDADGRAVLIGHTFLTPEMERTSAVKDIRGYTRSGSAAVEPLVECLRELGLDRGRIGAELGYEQRLGLTFSDFETLQRSLPRARFEDASTLMWRLRMIKSETEQRLMQKSAAITAKAFETVFEAAAPGVSERELARAAGETMMREGADRPGFIVAASGRENHHVLSGKPTERLLQADDMLWLDMGAVYQGYWSDFCRATIIGQPTAAQLDGQRAILDVNQACCDAVEIGEPLSRVAAAAETAFTRLGMDVRVGEGRIGHGIGLMSTEPPHVAHYEETLMEPGLVFTIEPRFLSDDGIFNCEELVLVTDQGAKMLTNAPRELSVIS